MNDELRTLFLEDGTDHSTDPPPHDLRMRDAARRARVEDLVDEGGVQSADDHYHAAMIVQRGGTPEHSWRAHVLARTAADLGVEGAAQWFHARGLAAATYDRWLVQQGRPQRYGTQYQAREGRWELYEVDPTVSDDDRASWGVPPLHESIARAHERTLVDPPRLHVDGLRLWPFSTRTRRSLAAANAEATRLGQRFIGPEHLLLGILDERGNNVAKALDEAGVTESLRARLVALINSPDYDALQSPPYTEPAWTPAREHR
ncbi:MAG: Clp protease N-terminal domain-containing protein [Candidatus Dormibacteraeota bacterium]|nr:Clp protease N-terminal domain-containing protein [Candidatus Dormibacteraeota bacterium]